MASTTKLQLTFYDVEGTTLTHSYSYADPDVSSESAKTFANVIIANKAVFAKQPITLKSARIVTTDTTDLSIE